MLRSLLTAGPRGARVAASAVQPSMFGLSSATTARRASSSSAPGHSLDKYSVLPHPGPGYAAPQQHQEMEALIPDPERRADTLKNFSGQVTPGAAGPEGMTGWRLIGGKADARGRYVTPHPGETRASTAVLKDWNDMDFEIAMKYPKGTKYLEGTVASQQEDDDTVYPGGATQMFLPDTSRGLLGYLRPTEEGIKKYGLEALSYGGYV
jgi:hypothetical protein